MASWKQNSAEWNVYNETQCGEKTVCKRMSVPLRSKASSRAIDSSHRAMQLTHFYRRTAAAAAADVVCTATNFVIQYTYLLSYTITSLNRSDILSSTNSEN